MTVIVTGSRDFTDFQAVAKVLDALSPTQVWHGGARGADTCANTWAAFRGVKVRVFLPDWAGLGKAAGPVRSAQMCGLAKPGSIVAVFCKGPLSSSPGTAACVRAARREGLRVQVHYQW